jgi:hypothetical protein
VVPSAVVIQEVEKVNLKVETSQDHSLEMIVLSTGLEKMEMMKKENQEKMMMKKENQQKMMKPNKESN